MAYFNHAFSKVFVGTTGFTDLAEGMLGTTGNVLATGEFAFVDPTTWELVATGTPPENCCPLVLAAGSIYSNDKVGPFHGGYQESNKSKMINPKYVNRFYKVEACEPTRAITNIGSTPYTVAEATPSCCKEFLCGETYHLRLDIKGSPALRFLNRQAYQTLDAYTGCCADDAISPTVVDSTLVMITWAQGIIDNPFMSEFILPVVVAEDLSIWYAPGTDTTGLTPPVGYTLGGTWDDYVSPGHAEGECAGLILNGAYIDTRFGDCSFQLTDFYEKEPLRIYASEVDLNGDPCTFTGICIVNECLGSQAMGLGETVLRDVVMSESYRQNFFHTDIRIREITQGDQMLTAIDRSSSYDRYCIQHSVPRFNNPTSTFDNDQYLLDIIVPAGSDQSVFEAFVTGWLADCSQCTTLETISCLSACEPTVLIPADL